MHSLNNPTNSSHLPLNHIVLFKVDPIQLNTLKKHLKDLATLAAEFKAEFRHGPYQSDEGLNQGYNYGFIMKFLGINACKDYLAHPTHEAIKAKILEIVELRNILAFDFV